MSEIIKCYRCQTDIEKNGERKFQACDECKEIIHAEAVCAEQKKYGGSY